MRKADLMRAMQPVVVRPVPAPTLVAGFARPVSAPRPAPRPVVV